MQQPQSVHVAQAGPLPQQGVYVGQAGPLPAGGAGQHQWQGGALLLAEGSLLPQQPPVLHRQPGEAVQTINT